MKKRKTKTASLLVAEKEMEKFLFKTGYTGKYKGQSVNEILDYRVKSNLPPTSDTIPGKSPKKIDAVYTGNEILGIVTTHKSNLVPIRKDNKQAAIDAAQMRRS
jgi:hypothetical protein